MDKHFLMAITAAYDLVEGVNQLWAGLIALLAWNGMPRLNYIFWLGLLCKVWICCMHQIEQEEGLGWRETINVYALCAAHCKKQQKVVMSLRRNDSSCQNNWERWIEVHTANGLHSDTHNAFKLYWPTRGHELGSKPSISASIVSVCRQDSCCLEKKKTKKFCTLSRFYFFI